MSKELSYVLSCEGCKVLAISPAHKGPRLAEASGKLAEMQVQVCRLM